MQQPECSQESAWSHKRISHHSYVVASLALAHTAREVSPFVSYAFDRFRFMLTDPLHMEDARPSYALAYEADLRVSPARRPRRVLEGIAPVTAGRARRLTRPTARPLLGAVLAQAARYAAVDSGERR